MRSTRLLVLVALAVVAAVVLYSRRGRPSAMPLAEAREAPRAPLRRARVDGEAAHRWTAQEAPEPAAESPAYRGVVVDRGGVALEDAHVKLCADRLCDDVLAEADTDDKGAFTVIWQPPEEEPGAHAAESTVAAPRPRALLVAHEGFARAELDEAHLAGAPARALRVVLRAPALVRGRVVTAGGAAVGGVGFGWYRAGAPTFEPSGTSEEDGSFVLEDLPALEIVVFALIDEDTTRLGLARVDLTEGGERVVEVVLEAAHTAHLSGRVVDRAGRPVAMVRVKATPVGVLDERAKLLLARASSLTAPDGLFDLDVGAAGRYHVTLWALDPSLDVQLAEWEGEIGGSSERLTLAIWSPTVRCDARGPHGEHLRLAGASVRYQWAHDRDRGVGRIHTIFDATLDEIVLPFPDDGGLQVGLILDERPHAMASVHLASAMEPCVAHAAVLKGDPLILTLEE